MSADEKKPEDKKVLEKRATELMKEITEIALKLKGGAPKKEKPMSLLDKLGIINAQVRAIETVLDEYIATLERIGQEGMLRKLELQIEPIARGFAERFRNLTMQDAERIEEFPDYRDALGDYMKAALFLTGLSKVLKEADRTTIKGALDKEGSKVN